MDERLERGIREFNGHRFFEAHETLESLWQEYRGDDRTFLQGLIQVAAGCFHLDNENLRGAESQFRKALAKLGAYLPVHGGLLLDPPLQRVRALLNALQDIQTTGRPLPAPIPFPIFEYSDVRNRLNQQTASKEKKTCLP
jgi:predicted metal-dependent hydrolase